MEEDKKEIIDEISVNNEESMNDVENSVQENDVKESETKKESSNVKSIVIILILFIILVGAGVYGLFFVRKEESNSNKDNSEITDNNIQEEIPTFSDDVVDEEVDNNIEGKVINIYQKGYAEKGPIAFTYECNSENCDLKVTDKGFILYDEDVVKYREMTSYEYEQINNSEISPIGSKLDMDGFEEVESLYNTSNIYNINDKFYILDSKMMLLENYLIEEIEGYGACVEIDNLILSKGYLYDSVNKNIFVDVYHSEVTLRDVVHNKIGSRYYYIYAYDSSCPCYTSYIYDIYRKEVSIYIPFSTYFVDNQLYFIDNSKVYILENDNDKSLFIDDINLNPKYIIDGNVIFLNKENNLIIKNISNGQITDDNIKVNNLHYDDYNGLLDLDLSVLDNDDFDEFRKAKNISDDTMIRLRNCKNDEDSCDLYYLVGYKINLNKNGGVSKEYYIAVDG